MLLYLFWLTRASVEENLLSGATDGSECAYYAVKLEFAFHTFAAWLPSLYEDSILGTET